MRTHRGGVAASSFTQDGFSAIRHQNLRKRHERVIDVVGNTFKVRATSVRVQVLVHIEDKAGVRPIKIVNPRQVSKGAVAHVGLRTGEIVTGKQDHLRRSSSRTDSSHGGLNSL